ncbi:endonuclease V [Thermomicrobium sp.]
MMSSRFVPGNPALSPLELERLTRLQAELAGKVVEVPLPKTPRFIAGADMHLRGERAIAVAVCFELLTEPPSEEATDFLPLREVARAIAEQTVTFPYIPGFLSFREAPVITEAVLALEQAPDLLVVDGQGRAHPRRCGLASHVGVMLDLPTIGAAKSRLYGAYREPGPDRGAWTPLIAEGEIIGAAVRTRPGARPLIVSVGHRITLQEAIRWVLRLSRYRIPEPTRWAHRYAKAIAALIDTGR